MECTDFYDKVIIEYATEEQITLPMNNMSDTKEEIYRQTFENCITKNLGKVHIPCTWLMFNIIMRSKDKQIMTLDECRDIAKDLGISHEDLPKVLWFLHYRVGSLLYYSEVQGFEDIIICDTKVSQLLCLIVLLSL